MDPTEFMQNLIKQYPGLVWEGEDDSAIKNKIKMETEGASDQQSNFSEPIEQGIGTPNMSQMEINTNKEELTRKQELKDENMQKYNQKYQDKE